MSIRGKVASKKANGKCVVHAAQVKTAIYDT